MKLTQPGSRPLTRLAQPLAVLAFSLTLLSAAYSEARIIDGNIAKAGEYDEVFAIQLQTVKENGEKGSGICSAVLIHERILLTAAHCVDGKENVPVKALNRTDFYNKTGGISVEVESYGAFPVWLDASTLFSANSPLRQANDVGYVVLKKAVKSVTPARFSAAANPLQIRRLVGGSLTLVGYGHRTILKPPADAPSLLGMKAWSEGKIEGYKNGRIYRGGLMGNTNGGDSGGAAYSTIAGRQTLVAIISSGTIGETRDSTRFSYHAPLKRAHLCWVQDRTQIPLGVTGCR